VAHDVFISYSHLDKVAADAVCATLEGSGIRCWVAPRDILPGFEWGEAIVDAIDRSKVMVLLFSANSNGSRQVRREVERALSRDVTIMPVRIDRAEPTRSMAYFMAGVHWLDALTPPLEKHFQRLASVISAFLMAELAGDAKEFEPTIGSAEVERQATRYGSPRVPATGRLKKRRLSTRWLSIGAICLVTIFAAALGIYSNEAGLTAASHWVFDRTPKPDVHTTTPIIAPSSPNPSPAVEPPVTPTVPLPTPTPPQTTVNPPPTTTTVTPPTPAPTEPAPAAPITVAPPPVVPALTLTELATALQTELHRVGCYNGSVDGNWGPNSINALSRYNEKARTNFTVLVPTEAAIDDVKKQTARVCPLVCPEGQVVKEGRCIIVEPPRPAPITTTAPPTALPQTSPPQRGGNCFTFNGQQVCN